MDQVPRTNRWQDGYNMEMWPIARHIGWQVQTAGMVQLDLIEPKGPGYNYGSQRVLPPKTRAVLKHIDERGRAYVYNDNGVMMMPVELLEPVGR